MSLSVSIEKRLGDFRLQVSFEAENAVHGLLGASGCGKSVTLRCIAGILRPDRGTIVMNGRTLFDSARGIDLAPRERRVGFLFQNYALFPNMTVEGNLHAALGKLPKAEAAARIEEMLRRFQLSDKAQLRPHQLSGGQQQRAALARILLTEPEILLLDEPLSALDSYLRWQTELELAELLDGFSGTALLVTHSREEVRRLCRTVTVLDHGRGDGAMPVAQLFQSPQTLSACLLSGCKNYSRAERLDDAHVRALDWGVTLSCAVPAGDTRYLAVRAHHIVLADAPGDNVISCRVLRVMEDVFSVIVMVATPGGDTGVSRLRLELPKEAWMPYAARDTLYLRLPPDRLLPLRE